MRYIYSILSLALAALIVAPQMTEAQNTVQRDSSKRQMSVITTNGEVNYYNTESVGQVKISDDKTIVSPSSGSDDVYEGNVREISFACKVERGNSGIYGNTSSQVNITESKGWQESAYVEWQPFAGAVSYNVYVRGGQYAEYTKIDSELVRDYGTYGRADVLGLQAGSDYSLRVVPVVGSDISTAVENSDAANEVTGLTVTNYSREGFAHLDYSGVGAYNDDGTLKTGAKVIYITAATAKTVTTTVNDGKKLNTVTGFQSIIDAYQKGGDTTPIAFRIIGKVSLDDLDHISSSSEGLQIKGRKAHSEMNITIEGVGEDATFSGFGILTRNVKSVELRNFAIMLCMEDCISLDTDNSHIWIHNLDLFYGNTGGAADQAKGDGTVDLKGDTQYVTISYNRFWDSGKSSLCGMKSETQPNYITYHHNWFDHSDSRHPRVRTMTVHVWNNYYDGVAKYGIGATTGSSVFVEKNYFRATKYPMLISMQGSDVATDGEGTFSDEDGGVIKSFDNLFAEKPSSFKYVSYASNPTDFDAYEVSNRDDQVPSTVTAKQGGTTYDNFDTDESLMYAYTPDAPVNVPGKVMGFYGAGRLNHGDFAWDFSGDDSSDDVDTALKAALASYESTLVGIFGE